MWENKEKWLVNTWNILNRNPHFREGCLNSNYENLYKRFVYQLKRDQNFFFQNPIEKWANKMNKQLTEGKTQDAKKHINISQTH